MPLSVEGVGTARDSLEGRRRSRALLSAAGIEGQDVTVIFDQLLDNETSVEVYLVDKIVGTDLDSAVLLNYCMVMLAWIATLN